MSVFFVHHQLLFAVIFIRVRFIVAEHLSALPLHLHLIMRGVTSVWESCEAVEIYSNIQYMRIVAIIIQVMNFAKLRVGYEDRPTEIIFIYVLVKGRRRQRISAGG